MKRFRIIVAAFLILPFSSVFADDMWHAAADGDLALIKSLLDEGAGIDALHPKSRTSPLMEAAVNNQHDAVRLLVESGAGLEIYCGEDSTALGYAAQGGDKALVEYLLSKGAIINGQREGGNTPLMRAAELGRPDVLQYLIEQGADIHFKARYRITAIHSAAVGGGENKAEKTKILLRAGAKQSAYSADSYTPLLYAAMWGNDDVVKVLLGAGVSPNESGGGVDALEMAFKKSNYDLADMLIDAGADPKTNANFSAPLAYAVNYGKLELAKKIIECGVPISRYESGLYGAAERGHQDCVELLSEHGSTLREQSWIKIYETVLERSYVRSHVAIARSMRLDGAKTAEEQEKILETLQPALDLLLAAHRGETEKVMSLVEGVMATEPWAVRDAVIYAKNEGRIDTIRALEPFYYKAKRIAERKPNDLKSLTQAAEGNNARLMERLLKGGADPNYGDKDEYSPMTIAIEGHHPELVKLMLDYGADPDVDPGQFGRSPLSKACYQGTPEIVKLLLDAGADPNNGGDWTTPLYFSAGKGDLESMVLLLKGGADVNHIYSARQMRGTPLIKAAEEGQEDAVEFLIQHGADVNKANAKGNTPFMIAVTKNHTDIARLLLRHGATPPDNMDALLTKINRGDAGNPQRIKELLSFGADPNAIFEDSVGHRGTLLSHALGHRDSLECVKLLLEAGADWKLVEGPLTGVTSMKPELIELLIKSGADVNQAGPNNGGARPLHIAAADGKFDLMLQLLEAGADPDLRTTQSKLTIEQYVMNTRRHISEIHRKERAQQAMQVIEKWKAAQADQAGGSGVNDE